MAQIISKIELPEGAYNERPNNEITQLINSESYMSVDHMVHCLSIYTMVFLQESRSGIKKRHLVRYDEALDRIYKMRSQGFIPISELTFDDWE